MIKADAERILTPYIPVLRSCILEAWEHALSVPSRHTLEPRTKSGIVRDYIVARVKEKFASSSDVKLIQTNKLFFLKIDQYLIRFKKLDANRLPKNYPTTQAIALEDQQLELPDISGHTFINAGYVTDPFETKITSAFLTCQRGKINDWEIMLGGAEHGFVALPVQQSLDAPIVIRPRKDLIEKEVNSEPLQSQS